METRGLPFASELRHVDLGSGLKGEQDPGERAEEGEPARDAEIERVPDDDAREELDQRDRQADLDADHRREKDGDDKECRYRNVARCPLPPDGVVSW